MMLRRYHVQKVEKTKVEKPVEEKKKPEAAKKGKEKG